MQRLEWETVQLYMAHHPRWFEDFGRRTPNDEHFRLYQEIIPADWRLSRRGPIQRSITAISRARPELCSGHDQVRLFPQKTNSRLPCVSMPMY